MKPLVYIAAPLTKPCPMGNTRRALDCWLRLWKSGLVVPFVPHLSILQEIVHPLPYDEWLEFDFQIINHCNALLRLPGESKGADKEEVHAAQIGIPIFHEEEALFEWARNLSLKTQP